MKYTVRFRYFNEKTRNCDAVSLAAAMELINSEAKKLLQEEAMDMFPIYVVINDEEDGGKIAGMISADGEFKPVPVHSEEYSYTNRKLIGSVTDLDLLKVYMKVKFPNGLYAVLNFYTYTGCDTQALQHHLFYAFCEEDAPDPPTGLCIWRISCRFKAKLMREFNKSWYDIWIFEDGELIDETR